jgi:hypothetical protein
MRKTAIAFLALGLTAVLVAPASATKFWTDSFSYPDGALGAAPTGTVNPVTGWLTHSNTGGGASDIQVVTGVAVANLATGAPDDSRPFAPAFGLVTGATDKTYSCMKFSIAGGGVALTATPVYIAHFKDNIPTGTTFTAKVFVTGIAGSTTTFNLGIANGPTNAPINWPNALSVDTWYTVATRFDAATGIASLWIDPVDETSASVSGTDTGATGRLLAAYGIRQSAANYTFKVDDLSVGTTFAETCGGGPVPTSRSTWGSLKSLYR